VEKEEGPFGGRSKDNGAGFGACKRERSDADNGDPLAPACPAAHPLSLGGWSGSERCVPRVRANAGQPHFARSQC